MVEDVRRAVGMGLLRIRGGALCKPEACLLMGAWAGAGTDDAFEEFKSLSAALQENHITAEEYFIRCASLEARQLPKPASCAVF
jgi:hypothetical protein